ncbi:hypothetical protein [Microbacterium halophytorum]|uniref:hypothetical protein n=1 Tax=Microbacterium halophytorum TaxID=2067568 RepID=UPI000CFE0DF1|nr:hypothetical protein [Microbacterium halophytorum]
MSDHTREPAIVAQGDLVDEISRHLVAAVEPGWERLVLHAEMTAVVEDTRFEITRGGTTQLDFAPDEVDGPLERLRAVMYVDGKGTWFTADITVTAPASVAASFDFDGEPVFEPAGVDAGVFVADQKRFPRSPENRPDWLRAKLAEAGDEDEAPDLNRLVAVGTELWRRMAPADAPLAHREVPAIGGVAVSHAVRGGGTIYVGADEGALFASSTATEEESIEAFSSGRRTPLEHFRPADPRGRR